MASGGEPRPWKIPIPFRGAASGSGNSTHASGASATLRRDLCRQSDIFNRADAADSGG